MKLQVFLSFSVLAFVTAQASAQTQPSNPINETRHAAATPAVTAPETAGAPNLRVSPAAIPPARAAVDPAPRTDAKPKVRRVQRAAPREPQQPEPMTWQERMRAMWGIDNPQSGQRPDARQPQAPAAPAYTARPNNRLLFGRFYTKIPRRTVAFPGNYAPGTIIVRHREKRLYYVLGNGQAIQYGVAVGREGAAWSGTSTVSNKREWPSWTPTPAILARQPNLPRHMEGGPQNPMGARALYLGDTLYRIHGTNEPWMIGEEVSSGCIRMTNEDVIDLYNRTRMGATVIVTR
jgi:lipoprotein-anchoring transpeptidase ErfK/SrfK